MTRSNDTLGDAGEILVNWYLSDNGFDRVEYSQDKYDQNKDIVAYRNNKKYLVEVKTNVISFKYNAFMIYESQWAKLDSCDFVFFVKVPTSLTETIDIYIDMPGSYDTVHNYGQSGTNRAYYLDKLKLVQRIDDPKIIEIFYNNSTSKYKR